jgi:hypothetical protein
MKKIVSELHQKYIINTAKGALVQDMSVFLCNLTYTVTREANLQGTETFVR